MGQLSRQTALHRLSFADFDLLASGRSDPAVMEALRQYRLSRAMLLIKHLSDSRPDVRQAATLFAAAQQADSVVTALLDYPWLGVWLRHALNDEQADRPTNYLSAIAVAAAERAGLGDSALLPPPTMHPFPVPGVGVFRRPAGRRWRAVADVLASPRDTLRTVRAGHGGLDLVLRVDDVDPFRDQYRSPVSARLAAEEIAGFQIALGEAWRLLVDYAPGRAVELAGGLTTVVPLAGDGIGRSITHEDAFGALALRPGADAALLASMLVHEFQHSKLNALHGLVPLFDGSDPRSYYAPWRTDARPIGGLLHGVYAFTAVAGWWRALRRDRSWEPAATWQFALLRLQVWRALEELATADGLTVAGRRMTRRLVEVAARYQADDVPAMIGRQARLAVESAERRYAR
jgi:HEXXH motif-containing protein